MNSVLFCALFIFGNILVISSESTTETTLKNPVKVEDTPDEFDILKPKDTTDPKYTSFLNELYKADKTKNSEYEAKRPVREAPAPTTSINSVKVEDTPDEFEIRKPKASVDPKYTDFIDHLYKADKVKESVPKTKRSAEPQSELPGQFDFAKPAKAGAKDDDFFDTLYKNDKVLLSSTAARNTREIIDSNPEDAIFKRLTRSKRMVVFRPLFV